MIWLFQYDYERVVISVTFAALNLVMCVVAYGLGLYLEHLHGKGINFSSKYLINPKRPETTLVLKAFRQALVEAFVFAPLTLYFIFSPLLIALAGGINRPLPPLFTILFESLVALFVCDTSFYWMHRALHTKALYNIHQVHHEFTSVVTVTSSYAHILELLGNIACLALGPLLMNSHWTIYVISLMLRLWESFDCHSGYVIPFSPWALLRSPKMHSYHHSHNVGTYGMLGFWDYICGTDKHFRVWLKKEESGGLK